MASCWVEVNLDKLHRNFDAVQKLVGQGCGIIAVVKANAYGHGAIEVGREFVAAGAVALAVTRLDEALPLRAAGLDGPILLLTPPLPDEVDEVVAQNLIACITGYEEGARLAAAAERAGRQVVAELKVNTGMGRLGIEPEYALDVANRLTALPQIKLRGAFTHFARAAERDTAGTHEQFARFQPMVHHLSRALQVPPHNFHCANSAALLRFPSMRLSLVRPGTVLYGQFPSVMSGEAAHEQGLVVEDAFSVKARIIAIKELAPGQYVGYGGEWRASKSSRIATIAVGYADGLSQEPNTHYEPPHVALRRTGRKAMKEIAQWSGLKAGDPIRTVSWRGAKAPIIGRIAMQQCSIDIGHFPEIRIGDEVVVTMRRTSAGGHLPRVYVRD